MQVAVTVTNGAVISRAFAQAPAMVLDELQATIGSLMLYLQRETQDVMTERDVMASGLLRQAWITRVDVMAQLDAVFGRLTNPLPYALPVELGSKPHWAPYAPILNWVEQKLQLYGDEAEAAATAIQYKIAARGTLARGMASTALAGARATIDAEFADCARRITSRLEAA